MDIIDISFLSLGALSLLIIIIMYVRGPWYRRPIGRFLVPTFVGWLLVYVFPIIRVIQGMKVTVSGLTFSIIFAILLMYGVYAFHKANKDAKVNVDKWES